MNERHASTQTRQVDNSLPKQQDMEIPATNVVTASMSCSEIASFQIQEYVRRNT